MFKQSHMNMNEDDKAYKGVHCMHGGFRPSSLGMELRLCAYIYMPG